MSYDISLKIFTGKEFVTVYDTNITSNVAKMYNKAFGVDYWCDAIEGKKCSDVNLLVMDAVVNMANEEKLYKLLEPSNGWGKYEDAFRVLKDLRDAVNDHPDCVIEIYK